MSDSSPSPERRCPECGAAVDPDAPDGLCTRCLARVGLDTSAEDVSGESSRAPRVPLGRFADYELLEEIGHGGMGVVYKARQLSLNRVVALKMLLGGQYAEAQARARFRAEAEIAAQLQHPHIVAIHEVGEHDNLPFFTMDYVEGRSLAELAQGQPLPARAAATYVQGIAQAIQYAHEHGVLHRDLKPSNILIDGSDQPRITDFGLAKRLTGSTSDLTVSGQALGSPNFMSPEQAAGKHRTVGPTSDIYGLGAILYYLVTSRPPFLADNVGVAVRQVQEQEPVGLRLLNPGVPRDLETICLKCLEKEPGRRYGSARELGEELGRFLRGEPIRARPISVVGRVWRWCRRRPALAALAAAVIGLAAVSTTVAVRMFIAQEGRDREQYRASIQLAANHVEQGNIDLALATLLQCPKKFRHWEWGYLVAQCHREVLTLTNAADPALPEQSDYLASNEPWSCRFSADGTRLAAIRPSSGVWIWEVPSGKLLVEAHPPAKPEAGVLLTPDWTRFVYIPTNSLQLVEVAELGKKEVSRRLEGHTAQIRRLAVSADGEWIAAFAADSTLRIWNLGSGRPQTVLTTVPSVERLQFTDDNRRLMASGSAFLATYDVVSGERLQWVDHQKDGTWRLFPSDDAGRWVTANVTNRCRLWSVEGPVQDLGIQDADDCAGLGGVVFSKGGRWFFLGGDYGSAGIYEARHGERLVPILGRTSGASFSPDGRQLAVVCDRSTIQLWDLESRRRGLDLKGHVELLNDLAFSPDGRLLASVSWLGTVKVWSAKWGRERFDGISFIHETAQSADGKLLAFGDCHTEFVKIWETKSGALLAQFRRARRLSNYCAFSPDSREIASCGLEGETAIWEVATGRLLRVLRGHSNVVWRVAWHPDGRRLATACSDGTTKVFDTQSGGELYTLGGTNDVLGNAVQFSPDGRFLALAAKAVWICDAATGVRLHVLPGHRDWVYTVVWSPDGSELATAGRDRKIRFWDAGTGSLRQVWQLRGVCAALDYSRDGRRIALRTLQGDVPFSDVPTTEIWDAETGRALCVFEGKSEISTAVSFSPDGLSLFADWWIFSSVRQWEAFPWREEEYPGSAAEALPVRMRRYADVYWEERLEAEHRGAERGEPLTVQLPWDRALIRNRDPGTPPQLLDLTPYYTSPIQEMSYADSGGTQDRNFRHLPRGQVKFNGVPFDVRGIIQLRLVLEPWGVGRGVGWQDMPEAVPGIPVRQRFRRLHLLLGTHGFGREGTAIAVVNLNYGDGRREQYEIVYGRHVRDCEVSWDPLIATDLARVAWEGEDTLPRPLQMQVPPSRLRVYQTSWDNPRPEVEVVSLDLVSKMTGSAPFVIAVTVE